MFLSTGSESDMARALMGGTRSFIIMAAAMVVMAGADGVAAQMWPGKTVRIVTPFARGDKADFYARIIAHRLSQALNQQFIVDNRPGAGSIIGTEHVVKSPADGYTFLVTSSSFSFSPALYSNLRYDSIKDLAPVTMVASMPHVIVVLPSLPVKGVQDLVRLARSKPGELTYSTAGHGSATHLAGALFGVLTQTDLVPLPYKNSLAAVIAVSEGEDALMFSSIETVVPLIRSGRLRALAVSTVMRAPLLPDVPTVIESGIKDYEVTGWFGVFAPANTPLGIIDQMRGEAAKVMHSPEIRERLTEEGATPVVNTPAEFGRFVRDEISRWMTIIRQAGIKLD